MPLPSSPREFLDHAEHELQSYREQLFKLAQEGFIYLQTVQRFFTFDSSERQEICNPRFKNINIYPHPSDYPIEVYTRKPSIEKLSSEEGNRALAAYNDLKIYIQSQNPSFVLCENGNRPEFAHLVLFNPTTQECEYYVQKDRGLKGPENTIQGIRALFK